MKDRGIQLENFLSFLDASRSPNPIVPTGRPDRRQELFTILK